MFATMAPIYPRQDERLLDHLEIPYEEVAFPTSDGLTLRGWFFPTQDPQAPAVLYAPATSHDQRSGISLVEPLHEAGFQVLLFSYRGHGASDGNRFGFTYGAAESKDIDAAASYLFETRHIQRIAAIGHSAGAVSIILSAAHNPHIRAVVAASPFNSVEEVWETSRPGFFPQTLFNLVMRISELRKGFSRLQVRPDQVIGEIAPRPLLLIYGSEDQRVTQKQAQRMFARAGGPKQLWLLKGASHQQVRTPGLDALMDRIIPFLKVAFHKA
jgi:dipeptidyl aminopeptidase/acylaminoacyl peptidase